MKLETIKGRLAKDRPMVSVTLRMPEDVITDMKRIALLRGFSGCQTLMRSYVGAGIREDLKRFDGLAIAKLIDLYPQEFFVAVELPQSLRRRLLQAA